MATQGNRSHVAIGKWGPAVIHERRYLRPSFIHWILWVGSLMGNMEWWCKPAEVLQW